MKSLQIYIEGLLSKNNKTQLSTPKDYYNRGRVLRNGVSAKSVDASASLAWSACMTGAYRHSYRSTLGKRPADVNPDFKWMSNEWGDYDWKAFGYWLLQEIVLKELVGRFKGNTKAFEDWWDSVAPAQQVVTQHKVGKMHINVEQGGDGIQISFIRHLYKPKTTLVKKRVYVDDEGNTWNRWSRGSKHSKTVYVEEPDYTTAGEYIGDDDDFISYIFYHEDE